jgi:1,4-alpha-glucan branching enzyme
VINSDAEVYGGSGAGNYGGLFADPRDWNGRRHSLNLTLPGNSTLIFKYEGSEKPR